MKEKYTPFGIRFENTNCKIKLRFHPKKWEILKIDDYMSGKWINADYWETPSGYIIFEASLDTKSDEYKEIRKRLNTTS